MDEGFVKFLVYLSVFCCLALAWDNFRSNAVNKGSVSVSGTSKTQVQTYKQNQDFYRGVPVNVYYNN